MNATKPGTRPTRLTVADVMTTSAVTAADAATFHELAALPVSHVWPPNSRRTERAQAQGITAGDVMSARAVTAGPSERLGVVPDNEGMDWSPPRMAGRNRRWNTSARFSSSVCTTPRLPAAKGPISVS